MLTWLDRYWHALTGFAGERVAQAVHWAEHAIAGVFLTIFHLVGRAWHVLYDDARSVWETTVTLAEATWRLARYVLRHVIPALARWTVTQTGRLWQFGRDILAALARAVTALGARITAAAAAISRWVLANVWAPLKAAVERTWAAVIRYGYASWQLLTHPAALVQLIRDPLLSALEAAAFPVARRLGIFTLALLSANLRRVAQLAEDIVTAVF